MTIHRSRECLYEALSGNFRLFPDQKLIRPFSFNWIRAFDSGVKQLIYLFHPFYEFQPFANLIGFCLIGHIQVPYFMAMLTYLVDGRPTLPADTLQLSKVLFREVRV